MADLNWAEVEGLFHRALEQPEPLRAAFVNHAAETDARLRTEVLGLLRAHTGSHPFLDAPSVSALPVGMRLGPYELERIVGAGGMGTVYLARRADRQFDKHVAIKLVNLGLAAELTGDRVRLERQILARLEHPNVARLLDSGVSEFGQPYLVMEWIEGVPLDRWVADRTPALPQKLELWLQVAAAVGYAHRSLIVHRDLKPSNVLVTSDGIPKLVDFGIARLLDESAVASATQTQRFTPLYASPEQIRGQAFSTSTDVYSLGVLLFELVVGAHPFASLADSPVEQSQAILDTPVAVPSNVPADLAAILQMALRKEPERRYASVDQFADDVRRYLRGWPVIAQPETVLYRLNRFVGRHRLAVAASAIATISLVALTGTALWQAQRATQQRARAEQVSNIIASVLGLTPDGPEWALRTQGVALRVVDLIDMTAGRVDRELGAYPEAEATLRSVLATAYIQMGQIDKARRHADRAVSLFEELASPTDSKRLHAELTRSVAAIFAGEWERGEKDLMSVRARWANPPPASLLILDQYVGEARFRLGRIDEAERTWLEAIRSAEHALGPSHASLGVVYSDLSLIYLERGEFQRAASAQEHAVTLGRSDPSGALALGWALTNLANTYRFLGRVDEVRTTAEESLVHMRQALGETHFSLIHPIAFIAWVKALRGEPDAEALIREGVALQQQLPADHFERAVGLTFLGFVLTEQGRYADAVAALERALELRRAHFKAPNWRIAETAGFLGEALARQGHASQARALLVESRDTFLRLYGSSNPRTVDAEQRLARWDQTAASMTVSANARGAPTATNRHARAVERYDPTKKR